MTLILERQRPAGPFPQDGRSHDRRSHDGERERKSGPIVNIALVNNMPDKALAATEQQFRRLLKIASRNRVVRLHCVSLPTVHRAPDVHESIKHFYHDLSELDRLDIHGLVVTGAEPTTASLKDEAFWPALTKLVDWAAGNTISTIWSCLAAHAAVLALDGIERRRLPAKCSGVFRCEVQRDHWLLHGLPDPARIPHSRYNGLSAVELESCGYEILTCSREAGVDAFARNVGSEFIFFQGHPEYVASSLGREYTRDIRRYLQGQQAAYPEWPQGYLDAATETALANFRRHAEHGRNQALFSDAPRLHLREDVSAAHRLTAETLFTNWIKRLLSSTTTVAKAKIKESWACESVSAAF